MELELELELKRELSFDLNYANRHFSRPIALHSLISAFFCFSRSFFLTQRSIRASIYSSEFSSEIFSTLVPEPTSSSWEVIQISVIFSWQAAIPPTSTRISFSFLERS